MVGQVKRHRVKGTQVVAAHAHAHEHSAQLPETHQVVAPELCGQAGQCLGTNADAHGALALKLEELLDTVRLDEHGLRRCDAARAGQAVRQRHLGNLVYGTLDQVGPHARVHCFQVRSHVHFLSFVQRLYALKAGRQEVVEVRKFVGEH